MSTVPACLPAMRCTLAVLALCALLARGARGQAFWLPSAVVVTLPEPVRAAVSLLHMAQPDLVITGPVASAPPTVLDFADFAATASDCAACWSPGRVKQGARARRELRAAEPGPSGLVHGVPAGAAGAAQAAHMQRMLAHLHAPDRRARPAASGTGRT